jgi:hypothetical protein
MYSQQRDRPGSTVQGQSPPAEAMQMTIRTTQNVVRFSSPFSLPGFDIPLPAGEYRVDQDEEAIQTEAHSGWARIATFIHLPAISARSIRQQMVPIDPAVLKTALEKDRTPR